MRAARSPGAAQDSPQLMAAINGFMGRRKEHAGQHPRHAVLRRHRAGSQCAGTRRGPKFVETIGFIRRHAATMTSTRSWSRRRAIDRGSISRSAAPPGRSGSCRSCRRRRVTPTSPSPTSISPNAQCRGGVKYLRFLRDRYFSDPGLSPLDRTLFSFAAYNAGPQYREGAQTRREDGPRPERLVRRGRARRRA